MRRANYDKYPSTKVDGTIWLGWKDIRSELSGRKLLAVDFYTGVMEEEVIEAFDPLGAELVINTRDLLKPEAEIRRMTERFMTDDVLFGYVTNMQLRDYFQPEKVEQARWQIEQAQGNVLVVGTGATWVMQGMDATVVYADMARWEIQQRFRAHKVKALGVDNRDEAISLQYKRGYFNDWRVCDKYKNEIFYQIDYWLDTHQSDIPKMIGGGTFMEGIERTVRTPFNFGWCFDCVPEENSLLLNISGTLFELPSMDLVLLKSRDLLGEPVEARFGKDFPIRFDFLDTIGGGNLSLQVHPTTQFIREQFGMYYTQDESYYMMDAEEDAVVYLGLKTGIDRQVMLDDLRKAQNGELVFDVEKYVNKIPTKKHDHFLIPGGTVHCSGANSMVLEISSTPNLFTFKLWDWQRLGLDGKPRPINVERGKEVIDWKRDTEYVEKYLRNHVQPIASGDGWEEEKTGLHENEFIETRRHWFTKSVTHHTNNSVNVLNLIEGNEVIVESPVNAFEPFVVHYAETFIVPACVGEYKISPVNMVEGERCATIKAYVRF